MATNVCICADSLEVDGGGRLCVKVAPDSACEKNLLGVGDAGGLQVLNKTYTLQRNFTAESAAASLGAGNFGASRAMADYGTTVDNGSAAGLWTINGDGTITVHCSGIYSVAQQTGVAGATSQVTGGRSRVSAGVLSIASTEFHDFTNALDLAPAADGPEFSTSNARYLVAGTSLSYDSRVYSAAASGGITYAGEFTLTYLGAFA